MPRLQLSAWRSSIAEATTTASVINGVQRVVNAWHACALRVASTWAPRQINSREDIEHWARRLSSHSRRETSDPALAPLAEVMRTAVERLNELVPRKPSS